MSNEFTCSGCKYFNACGDPDRKEPCSGKTTERPTMTVKDLKESLEAYNDDAEIVIVDSESCSYYDGSIGSNDSGEYTRYCHIVISK